MSAVTSDSLARDWARRLETKEAQRSGLSLGVARKRVAGRLGILPGTLENLSRERIKGVRHWIFLALHEAVKAELKREMAAHEHELEILERLGRDASDTQVQAAMAGYDALRARLTGTSG